MLQQNRRTFLHHAAMLGGGVLLPIRSQKPNVVLHNGRILTMDQVNPMVEALAIYGDRILAVGSSDEMLRMAGSATKLVNLGGETVVPGFNDAHSHPGGAGRRHLTDVDCDLRSIEEIKDAVAKRAKNTPKGEWVWGFKYDDTKTRESRFVTKADLDLAAPGHPVVIVHRGGHSSYVNSLALEKAGIGDQTKNPEGGKFVRDVKSNELTGRVLETANNVFDPFRPVPDDEDFVAGVKLISKMLAKVGITSVTDAGGSPRDLRAYQTAFQRGELLTRIYCHIRGSHLDKMMQAGVSTGFGNHWVRVGAMKTGIDGSISERTARLSKPYIGSQNDYGILTATDEELYSICKKAHLNQWQLGVHANGDVGIDKTLDVFEKLQKEYPRRDPRFRLEHCTVINTALIKRIKNLGAIPNPFSTYVYFHGEKMKYYGKERLNSMFAVRSFLDEGIKVTQTSDYPPGPFEPMMALQSSVTRTDMNGNEWGPDQKISIMDALRVGTVHGAYASFEEHAKGSLRSGKLADLVVLDKNPLKANPFDLINIKIQRTMVGGKWVYEA